MKGARRRARRGAPAPACPATALAGILWVATVLPACGLPQRPTDADLIAAQGAAPLGAKAFATVCASCHGARGQGIGDAPPVLGPGALPEFPRDTVPTRNPLYRDLAQMQIDSQTRPVGIPWREPFRNAQDLASFLTGHLAKSRAAKLQANDVLPVVAYLIVAQGGALPAEGLTPENARFVPIPHL